MSVCFSGKMHACRWRIFPTVSLQNGNNSPDDLCLLSWAVITETVPLAHKETEHENA